MTVEIFFNLLYMFISIFDGMSVRYLIDTGMSIIKNARILISMIMPEPKGSMTRMRGYVNISYFASFGDDDTVKQYSVILPVSGTPKKWVKVEAVTLESYSDYLEDEEKRKALEKISLERERLRKLDEEKAKQEEKTGQDEPIKHDEQEEKEREDERKAEDQQVAAVQEEKTENAPETEKTEDTVIKHVDDKEYCSILDDIDKRLDTIQTDIDCDKQIVQDQDTTTEEKKKDPLDRASEIRRLKSQTQKKHVPTRKPTVNQKRELRTSRKEGRSPDLSLAEQEKQERYNMMKKEDVTDHILSLSGPSKDFFSVPLTPSAISRNYKALIFHYKNKQKIFEANQTLIFL